MNPVRVTPPDGPVVGLEALKDHLRVVGTHDDAKIESLEAAAVAHLDGWRGVLGRCILPQEWAVEYPGAGKWRLPFPDVTEVSAENAESEAIDAVLSHDAIGSLVEIGEAATVTLKAAMPDDALEVVRMAVKIWVKARYDDVEGPALVAADAAFHALIGPLRRVRT